MKIKLYLVSIFLLFLSCKKNMNSEINLDVKKNDTVRNYYVNGNLRKELIKVNDTIIFVEYYQNGNLKTQGKLYKDQPIGIWKIYNENKSFKEISEFIIDREKSFINQQIIFKNDNNIDYTKSIFYQINSDTLKYHSPLDTLSSKIQKNREIKLITYNKDEEKQIKFKNGMTIKDYSFPLFIFESVSIQLDSVVDGDSLTRLINRQLLVKKNNIFPDSLNL